MTMEIVLLRDILAFHHDLILRRMLKESTKGLMVLLGEANIWHGSMIAVTDCCIYHGLAKNSLNVHMCTL